MTFEDRVRAVAEFGLPERGGGAGQFECAARVRTAQRRHKLAAKDTAQDLHG